ncbi:LysM peptidoglycan-binding domain-containing protein, partial [Streptomyces sp. NPDC020766]|uniref:LysM peptidoglycan-binding domain-containing protein n=1 Tax=Streptomyces sp. NPDC020766 TaxID=3155011 RepID=UPI0033F86098
MAARGKHRRTRMNTLTRGIVAAGTGGAALALPLVGATGAHAAQPTQAAQVAPAAVPQVSLVTYKVVAGDTLTKIAKKHSTSGGWQNLYKANRAVIGDDPAVIRPGLKLTVGTKNAQTSAKTATATKASTVTPAAAKTYSNNLDGWIRESLDIMAQQGIPGSYDGIYRNVMRESSGNPQAMNNWDSNAAAGTPSKGLLQTIDPTFNAYHVAGTSMETHQAAGRPVHD